VWDHEGQGLLGVGASPRGGQGVGSTGRLRILLADEDERGGAVHAVCVSALCV